MTDLNVGFSCYKLCRSTEKKQNLRHQVIQLESWEGVLSEKDEHISALRTCCGM